MASSSNTTSNQPIINSISNSQTSFTFAATVKLDRSNFLLWRKQVLMSIRGNRLERFISEPQVVPDQYLSGGSGESIENPAYINWRAQDQTLLGWLLSTVSEGILSSVLNHDTSFDMWRSIEKQFGVQSEAKIMQLRYEMNILSKDSMNVEEYCAKMKLLANKLACAGDIITEKDLLMRVLNGLGPGYLDLASIITANKMSFDDAYALLLTHEARLEQNHSTKTMFNANYSTVNVSHPYMRGNFRRGGFRNGHYGRSVNRGFNTGRGMFHNQYPRGVSTGFGNFGGYGRGQMMQSFRPPAKTNPSLNMQADESPVICQICHKTGHTSNECWHRYDDPPLPKQFGRGKSFGPKAAYVSNFDPYTSYAAPPIEEQYAATYPCYNPISYSSFPAADSTVAEAYLSNYDGPANEGWYLDSGATHHLTNSMANMNVREEFRGADQLVIGNGQGLPITHIGNACFTYKGSNNAYKPAYILLKDMLLVPDITKNLLSISKLTTDNNLSVEFVGNVCYVKDSLKKQVLLKGIAEKGLYKLLLKPSESSYCAYLSHSSPVQPLSMLSAYFFESIVPKNTQNNDSSCVSSCNASINKFSSYISSCDALNNKVQLLHRRFGHPNSQILMHLLKSVPSVNLSHNTIKQALEKLCEACQMGKTHRLHFPSTETKTTKPLELIHTDLWGPSPTPSRDGYNYYISLVDDFSRYTWIYPLKLKSEALDVFKLFKLQVENQFDTTIKNLQSDWGGEYRSFTQFLNQCGIIFRHSCPYTHHQNGLVERKHRHIVELGLTLLAQAKLPFKFWWDAFHTAVYHINRLPSTALELLTPYEKIFKLKPDYSMLKCFGCICYPYLRDYNKHKFDYHSSKCIFLGYSPAHKGYKCLHSSGKIYIARHVVFDESTFPYSIDSAFNSNESSLSSSSSLTPQQVYQLSTLSVTPMSDVNNLCNSQQAIPTRSSSQHSDNSSHINNQHSHLQTHLPATEPFVEPQTSSSPHHTVHPTSTPIQPNTHPMTTRSKAGIFKPKLYTATLVHKEPDSVYEAMQNPKWLTAMREEYAALMENGTWSLVPRIADQKVVGNKWVYRVKYNIDGSVAKYKARLVAKGFQQIMGVNCFETFSPVIKPATVRVVLSLAVMSNWKIRQVDVNNAFLNGELSEEVFMDQPEGFISAEKPDYVCKLHKSLYRLKQAPRAWYDKLKGCLLQWGFTNSNSDTSLFLKRSKSSRILVLIYVDDILITGPNSYELEKFIAEFSTKFALKDLGTLSYFLGIEVLYGTDCIFLSQKKYIRDLLSKVNMLSCKDIDTPMSTGMKLQKEAQGTLGHYVEDATHYRSLVGGMQYLVLRYLKATQDYGLKFIKDGHLKLTGFTYADWAGDLDDRKSVGAYCIYLGHNLISWSSKKQPVIARSSAESEYRSLASASAEISWLQSLFSELRLQCMEKPVIWCDNLSATELAHNPVFHSRTKHIEIDIHYVRNKVLAGDLNIQFIPSEEQVADIMTKPLSFTRFSYLRAKLNVMPCPLSLRGAVKAAHYSSSSIKPRQQQIASEE
ncbi:retrovirus-related pol polyprotein from transposon RE2 [Citrus sinensis]|nr:retrovirus-related pol polyprotein from transposon RE2 [Citrus sinensis]